MSDKHVSMNIFDLIDSICADFRREWKAGKRPRIEEYLDQVSENARAQLFRNLLTLDFRYRGRAGEEPASGEYIRRFPDFKRAIGDVFQYSTSISIEAGRETPREDSEELPVTIEAPAANRIGDYELIRELGRGGFGVVYEAKHVTRRNRVALKTLPTGQNGQEVNAERLHKFRREFRSLSQMNHPNLVGMQTLEVAGDQWFFTMDLLDGVDFLAYVRPNGNFHQQRLRGALTQIVRGIVALHEQGVVHRDLKPSNVLVSGNGQVVILDFGLVTKLQQPTAQTVSLASQQFAGTPRYAAPEQANGTVTEAADWYALGVMLYEALTGESPFEGPAIELLLKKKSEDAPTLAGNAELPQDLAELIDQLLAKEPHRRPDAHAIAKAVDITIESSSRDSTDSSLATVTATDSGMFLIGRESQLADLENARRELLATREPVVVFIRGRSGEGKTSLAEKFLTPLRRGREMLVLSGRCYDRESVPFKAVDCLIDALVAFLRSRSTDEVLQLLPDDIHMLAQLFPVLRRVEAVADRATQNIAGIDSRQIRYRAFAALRELLTTVGESTPVILFVDDLQWGDADSAGALFELLQPPNPPAVILAGSYRSDEASESPFLNEWRGRETESNQSLKQVTIEVSALTEEQCVMLFAARLARDSESLREQVSSLFEGTQGNPYFLEQLIEGFDTSTGEFHAVPLNEIIDAKLSRLPSGSASLLEAIAIAGEAIALDEAASVAEHTGPSFATITHMRSERLVRLIGSSEQQLVDTYHDKIRETVLDGLGDSQRRDLHLRFGELLEQTENVAATDILAYLNQDSALNESALTTDRIFDLAYHFHAAGDPRGFAYQLMAGEQSYRVYASEDAIEFLKRAQANLPGDATDGIRYRMWERMATSLSRLALFEPAFGCYEQAIDCAPSDLARAMAHAGVAAINLSRGQYTAAGQHYDLALHEIGAKRLRSVKAVFSAALMAARIFLIPKSWRRPVPEHSKRQTAFEQKIYANIGTYIFDQPDSLIDYPYAVLRLGALSLRAFDDSTFASGLSLFAGHVAINGWPNGGKRLLKRTSSIAEQVEDLETLAVCVYSAAIVHQNARELQLADLEFQRSTALAAKSGYHVLASCSAHLHRHLYAVIGTSTAERDTAASVLALAEQVGDIRGQCWGHYDLASALARAGDIGSAKSRIEQARSFLAQGEMNLTEAIFLGTQGFVFLQASDYDAARASCESSWEAIKNRKLVMEYTLRSLPWLIESIAGPDWTTSSNLSDRTPLKRLCRVAQLMYWFYPNLQSPVQRVRGRAFWVLGKRRKAIRCFERAVKCAASLGADYDRARSMLDLAAVQENGRDDLRCEAVEILRRMESVIPYAERWLLGDQYDESVVAPEFDLEAWEREHGSVRMEHSNKD